MYSISAQYSIPEAPLFLGFELTRTLAMTSCCNSLFTRGPSFLGVVITISRIFDNNAKDHMMKDFMGIILHGSPRCFLDVMEVRFGFFVLSFDYSGVSDECVWQRLYMTTLISTRAKTE
ncbi:hypothetical protein SARC_06232, partial [Sphaeroforma arctica JP610]